MQRNLVTAKAFFQSLGTSLNRDSTVAQATVVGASISALTLSQPFPVKIYF